MITTSIIFILLSSMYPVYKVSCFENQHHVGYMSKNHLLIITLHSLVSYFQFNHTVSSIYCILV